MHDAKKGGEKQPPGIDLCCGLNVSSIHLCSFMGGKNKDVTASQINATTTTPVFLMPVLVLRSD
jgi:hypothetical protein